MRSVVVLLLVAGCGSGSATTSAPRDTPRYSLQQFLRVKRSTNPTLSPDGTRVAFASNASGVYQPMVAPAAGGPARALAAQSGGIGGLWWSPAGDDILISADRGGDQNHQLFLAGADGSALRPLTTAPDVKHDRGGWSSDGRAVFYASNARDRRYFDCYVMDVASRRERRVLQRDAVMRCSALSTDGRWIAAVDRISEVDHRVYVAETATGATRLVTPGSGAARYKIVGFSPDATSLYVVTDAGRDFMNLGAIDLASTTLRFLEDGARDTDAAILSPDGRRLALSHNVDGYEQLAVLVDGAPRALPALPRGIVLPGGFSADGRRLAVFVSTPTHDDDVYVVDLERRTVTRVTHSDQAGLDERDLVTPELVKIRAKDGRAIPAFLYLPRHARGGKLPAIVSIHGGPEDQEQPWFWASYQYLTNRGYAVIAPNIRGSTGYGKQYLALDNGERRWDALADLVAVVDWLRARDDIDRRRIVGFGASYGGFMVLAMLAHYPDRFAAGVDFYGPSDLATFLERTAEYRRGQRIAEYGDPGRDAAFLAAISPAKHVDRITAPLLIVQGANDPIVPPAESKQLVDALRARGRTVRYLELPDEGHGFDKEASQIRAFEAMAAFLDGL